MFMEFEDLDIARSKEGDFDIALRHLGRAIENVDFEGPGIATAYADPAREAQQAAIAEDSGLTGPVRFSVS